MSGQPAFTLRGSMFAYAVACMAAIGATGAAFVHLRGDRFTDSTLAFATKFRTAAAAGELARTLERDWRDLAFLSERIGDLSISDQKHLMTGAAGDSARIAWVGYAGLDGSVLSATDDLYLGQDVTEQLWYREGLTGGFAGQVRHLVGPSRHEPDQPAGVIELSMPVSDDSGDLTGVLGMHIYAGWIDSYLRETGSRYGIDLYLINPKGEICASSNGDMMGIADLNIIQAAQVGTQLQGRETWPDGEDYFSILIPNVTHGDLPDPGWRMIGRLEASSVRFGVDLINNGAHYAVGVAVILILILTAIFSRIFITPIERLAYASRRIADGSRINPPVSRSTEEAQELSEALSAIQLDRVTRD